MTNRVVFFILGIVIIAIGFAGFYYFDQYQKQQVEIRKLEAITEQERQKARAAEEARREQEERKLAEEKRRQAEKETVEALKQQILLEKQRRIAQERRERELQEKQERQERERREEEDRRRIQEERQREIARARQREESEAARRRQDQERAEKTINMQFPIDVKNSNQISVAHVYEGDKITINVTQRDGTDKKLYVGFLPMRIHQEIKSSIANASGRSRRSILVNEYFARGPQGDLTLVTMPINDHESFTISDQINSYHPDAGRIARKGNNKEEGGILLIGTGLSKGTWVNDMFGSREGTFYVSVEIFSANKWGLKPKKLL